MFDGIHYFMPSASLDEMPAAELAYLTECYANARVILEYGSGNSTEVAAAMPGKYVMSVESDRKWARDLRARIAASRPKSMATVFHVDIGTTADWGRAVDDTQWRNFHRYPNAIWDQPFFRQPELVLIDGRFRTACFAAVILHTQKPVRVLFDDYRDRPKYRLVERIVKPDRLVGRMAQFTIRPEEVNASDVGFLVAQFFQVTLHGAGKKAYKVTEEDVLLAKRATPGPELALGEKEPQ